MTYKHIRYEMTEGIATIINCQQDMVLVSHAASGAEALRYVDSGEACDAVITDVVMPGMSGVEFARRARVHSVGRCRVEWYG